MHSEIAEVSLATIKARIAEGDCPTIKPYSVEVLEELVVHFAERAAVAPVAVSVKGRVLEWYPDPGSFPHPVWGAQSSFGRFTIEEVSASDSPAYEVRYTPFHLVAITDSLEDAKAAAQADFNARILSSIIPATKGGEDAEEQPGFTYYECPECGFDVIHKADYEPRSTACPICAGDSGHDVGMNSRTARATDRPEGKDARPTAPAGDEAADAIAAKDTALAEMRAELERLADCLNCARMDWEGNNGEIIDKSDPHWTVEARRLCAARAASQDDGEER